MYSFRAALILRSVLHLWGTFLTYNGWAAFLRFISMMTCKTVLTRDFMASMLTAQETWVYKGLLGLCLFLNSSLIKEIHFSDVSAPATKDNCLLICLLRKNNKAFLTVLFSEKNISQRVDFLSNAFETCVKIFLCVSEANAGVLRGTWGVKHCDTTSPGTNNWLWGFMPQDCGFFHFRSCLCNASQFFRRASRPTKLDKVPRIRLPE